MLVQKLLSIYFFILTSFFLIRNQIRPNHYMKNAEEQKYLDRGRTKANYIYPALNF